jgi:uncharacterized protein YbaR (Trm112 family)
VSINVLCPHCKKTLKVPSSRVGSDIACPACSKTVKILDPKANVPALLDFDKLGINANTYQAKPPVDAPKPPPLSSYLPKDTEREYRIVFDLPEHRNYFALQIVRFCLLGCAGLVALGWLASLIIVLFATASTDDTQAATGILAAGTMYLVMQFVVGAIVCLGLIAASELIKVVIDIHENTLATAHHTKK